MEIDYISHHLLFFASFGMGLFSGAVYDALRIPRLIFKSRVFLFFADILFCIYYSCFMCILFFNYSHGRIRAYGLLTSALGFAAYYFTFGKLTKSIFYFVQRVFARIVFDIKNKAKRLCAVFYRKAYSYFKILSLKAKASKGFGSVKKRTFRQL